MNKQQHQLVHVDSVLGIKTTVVFEIENYSITHENILARSAEIIGHEPWSLPGDRKSSTSKMDISCRVISHELTYVKPARRKRK